MPNKITKNKKPYMLGREDVVSPQAEDEAALEAIFTSTNGATDWNNTRGWSASGMSLEDDIYGVETTLIDGELRVESIKLDGNETIDLSGDGNAVSGGNGLTGTLPEEIQNLEEMWYFSVKQNNMSGELPDVFDSLVECTHLQLSGTTENDVLDSTFQKHAGKTDTAGNDFSGSFPDSIFDMPKLQILDLSGSAISDTFPTTMSNCSTLQFCQMSWNRNISGNLPDLNGMDELRGINISRNGSMSIDFDGQLDNNPKLVEINIGNEGMEVTGTFPNFRNAPDIRFIKLTSTFDDKPNNIGGEFPNYLFDGVTNPQMSRLYLIWDELTGEIDPIAVDNLTVLDLTGNNLSGTLPDSIFHEDMIILGLERNDFTGTLPGDATACRQIRNFWIHFNDFEGRWPIFDFEDVDKMSSASRCNMSNNRFVFSDMLYVHNGKTLLEWYSETFTTSFGYGGQKDFGDESDYDADTGIVDFSNIVTHADNNYTWQRSTDGGSTFSTISGETSNTLDTSPYNTGDQFYLSVTNTTEASLGSGLTIDSTTITI